MSNKPGYKPSPLGMIPQEWEVYKIGELLSKGILVDHLDGNHGELYPRSEEFVSTGVPYLSANNFFNGYVDFNSCKFLHPERAKQFRKGIAKNGDVLFAHNATVGPVAILNTELEYVVLSTTATYFRCNPNLLSNLYLREYFTSDYFINQYSRVMGQSTRNQVPITTQRKFYTILPKLSEQKKIASILYCWDEAILYTQQILYKLLERNKGLTLQLLTGKKKLKGFNKPWKEIHLAEAFIERNETGYLNLDLLSVGSLGIYPQSQSEKRDTSNSDKAKYKRICPGDIGYNTMRMWQGRSALSSLEGIVSPAYTIVTPKENQYSKFYAYLFRLPSVINKFFRNSQGLVEDTLNCKFKDFAKVKVEVPEYEAQVAIANILNTAHFEIKAYEQKLFALQHQKKGLMQKLLTGEVRVKIEG
ncbi:restriction endonuclease subunit S [Pontibacter chitinilyticus]|uniref:restriction endonuclease subunit S n=1 Tax=Pontibacter chitinilyticus TaxID=2674989 RepID=UPI00321A822D